MIYFAMRKHGSIGRSTVYRALQTAQELSAFPDEEVIAAFQTMGELRRFVLSETISAAQDSGRLGR